MAPPVELAQRSPLVSVVGAFVAGALMVALLWYSNRCAPAQLPAVSKLLSTASVPTTKLPRLLKTTKLPTTSRLPANKQSSLLSVQNRRITAGQSDPCAGYPISRQPTPDEQKTIVVLSPSSRAASLFLSHRVQYYSSAYTYRIVMLDESGIDNLVKGFLDWACHQHPGPKVFKVDHASHIIFFSRMFQCKLPATS
jgi:hypothetical protein